MSLIGWWKLDGDTLDRSPYGNHGSILGTVTWEPGKVTEHSAQFLYASASRVEIPHNSFLSSAIFGTSEVFSFSFWGYFTAYQNYGHIIGKTTGGSWSNTTAGVWVYSSGIRFIIGSNEGGNPSGSSIGPTYAPALNEWHHFACVADGTLLTLYVDGINRGTGNISSVTRDRSENESPIRFGDYNTTTTQGIHGKINDMRFYDHALTEKEIEELLTGRLLSLKESEKLYRNKILHYKLDNDTYDSSEYKNHGTNNGATKIEDSIIGSGAYRFSDQNTFISPPEFSMASTDNFTVTYWFKTNRATNYSVLHHATTWGDGRIRHTNASRISPEPSIVNIDLSESFSTGVWEHFSFVRSEGVAYIYRNGKLVGQGNWTGSPTFSKIGGKPDTSSWSGFDGDVDDIRIYATALSASEIKEIYEQRSSIDSHGNFFTHEINETGHKPLLLDYTVWENGQTGSVGSFGRNGLELENHRILGIDPWGKETVLWEARPDGSGEADGGWNHSNTTIDNTKLYRFSTWVNRSVKGTNGNFYLGCRGYGSVDGVYVRGSGTNTTNPYFWAVYSPLTEGVWELVVGHVWPVGSGTGSMHEESGYYRVGGRIGNISNDFVWREETIYTRHRSYLYYATDSNARQLWCYPRLDICDGTEPSINDLLSGFDSNNIDYIRGKGGTSYISLDVGSKITTVGELVETGPTNGLMGWWPFEEDAKDVSGNQNHGIVSGATLVQGIDGMAYEFNGSNNYIRVDNNVAVSPTELTISGWFKKTGVGDNYNCVIHKATNTTVGASEYWMGTSAGHNLTATIGANTSGLGWNSGETSVTCVDNVWYHMAATWDGEIVRVYVDGNYNKQYNLSIAAYTHLDSEPTRFGASNDGTVYRFAGLIDDIRIYNRALTGEEIEILYDITGNFKEKIKQTKYSIYSKGYFSEV